MEITLYSLSDYNAGRLIPKTFDLDLLDDQDEYYEAVNEWLESLGPGDFGLPREEWIVADFEDIPDAFVGEYDLDTDFWEFKDAVDSSYLDAEVFAAAADLGIPMDKVEEAYSGEFESDEQFAQHFYDDIYSDAVSDAEQAGLQIDWYSTASSLMQDYSEQSGHYFSSHC